VGSADTIKVIKKESLSDMGAAISPFNAWLLLRGLKTLSVRMERHSANAIEVARFLSGHPKVDEVWFPWLPSHPQHALARAQMAGFGSMISFEMKGGLEAGRRLMDRVRLAMLAVSLGGVETLIEHPASMTHAGVSRAEREAAGITDGLVRYSVGIEDVADLIEDLRQALEGA
jgi:methionine-gamma-lyase